VKTFKVYFGEHHMLGRSAEVSAENKEVAIKLAWDSLPDADKKDVLNLMAKVYEKVWP